jgi:tetratricopeptide (TPR) repeat protein
MLGRVQLHPETANAQAALRHLTGARELGMNSDELNRLIVRAMLADGKLTDATTDLALNFVDENAQWLILRGLLALAVGRFDDAKIGLARAIDLAPDSVEARRAAIRTAVSLGDTAQARVYVEEALAVTQGYFELWGLKGDLAGHDKRYDDAFEAYSKALRIAPGNSTALLRRAAVAVATEDTESALADLDSLSDASNEHPMALHLRGFIARQRVFRARRCVI